MSDDAPPAPARYSTGPLWAVLTLLLLGGTVAAAFFVYGFTDLLGHGRWLLDVPVLLVSGFAATFLFLLLTGVLYRVDRLRGATHREVRLFE
ncbi:MAG TPA: hypothetical protein VMH78_04875 [Thermoplasmata archaeon]|nr:hypothetical protein [Thermoplasmata archaeon]